MNSREHLSDNLDLLVNRTRQIGWVAWGVAIFVMIYGTPIVYDLATNHGIPAGVAWMLSLAADGALCVGLIGSPVLAQLGINAGWVGTLRWVSGFITWSLQTLSSWIAPHGPDMVGVGVHTAGPALLFFVVEAASYFQRKVSAAINDKIRALESAEQRDADDRAHRAEVDAKLRSTIAELTAARSEITALTERLTATAELADAEKSAAMLTVERLEAEIGSLRTALTGQREELTAHHAEALRKLTAEHEQTITALKAKHAESLAKARAEKKTVNLTEYRDKHAGKGSPQTSPQRSNQPAMSDEEAVQAMFTAHPDPNYEWSQNEVRTLTRVGFNARMERLIAQWQERALREANGEAAVNQ